MKWGYHKHSYDHQSIETIWHKDYYLIRQVKGKPLDPLRPGVQKEIIYTIEILINGHFKRQSGLINGQTFLHLQNLGQILVNKSSKWCPQIADRFSFN